MLRAKLKYLLFSLTCLAIIGFCAFSLRGDSPVKSTTPNAPSVEVAQKKGKKGPEIVLPFAGKTGKKKVQPKKKPARVTARKLPKFSYIVLMGSGNVIVKQSNRNLLTIKGPKRLAQAYLTRVQNNTLYLLGGSANPFGGALIPKINLPFGKGVGGNKPVVPGAISPIEIHVEVKNLLGLAVNGAGNMSANDVDTKKILVSVGGAGSLMLSGKADELQLGISGTGSYLGEFLRAKTATVKHLGLGKAVVCATKKLRVQILGTGLVEYIGAPKIEQSILGSGAVRKKE